jgi:Asp-tRNA(Asn)/Glu-tRNA(Gln) amidotransferase B subunit
MNSFNAMSRAIDFEIARQTALIRAGKGDEVVQETRTWWGLYTSSPVDPWQMNHKPYTINPKP